MSGILNLVSYDLHPLPRYKLGENITGPNAMDTEENVTGKNITQQTVTRKNTPRTKCHKDKKMPLYKISLDKMSYR